MADGRRLTADGLIDMLGVLYSYIMRIVR